MKVATADTMETKGVRPPTATPMRVSSALPETGIAPINHPIELTMPRPNISRFELWPHKKAAYVYPYLYESEPADLEDPGAVVPRNIRGDVLFEHALAACARWPGDEAKPNPYYDLRLAETHQGRANRMVIDLELADDETQMNDFTRIRDMDFAPFGDAAWLQSHAL